MPFGKYLLAETKRPNGGVEGRAIQLREDGPHNASCGEPAATWLETK
jgi:hypothetical protein